MFDITKLRKILEKVVNDNCIDAVHFSWTKRDLDILTTYKIICQDYLVNHNDFFVYIQVNGNTEENVTFSKDVTKDIIARIVTWAKKMDEIY